MSARELSAETHVGRPGPPLLRIYHLLACAAVAAVQLTCWRMAAADMFRHMFFGVPSLRLEHIIVMTFFAVSPLATAAGFTLAILSIWWRVKGIARLVDPGQWLLVSHVVTNLRWISFLLIAPMLEETPTLVWSHRSLAVAITSCVLLFVYCALPVLFFAYCAWRIADTRPWRVLFAVMALWHLFVAVQLIPIVLGGGEAVQLMPIIHDGPGEWEVFPAEKALLYPFYSVVRRCRGLLAGDVLMICATMIFAIAAPVTDYRRAIRRVWSHWVGVGTFIAGLLPEMILAVTWLIPWEGV